LYAVLVAVEEVVPALQQTQPHQAVQAVAVDIVPKPPTKPPTLALRRPSQSPLAAQAELARL
jgi:hypothetical protein